MAKDGPNLSAQPKMLKVYDEFGGVRIMSYLCRLLDELSFIKIITSL